ncbi:hypothetical protein AOQ84DRAFT_377815 [Glonium stellatum]|uniref:Uncharacterized protein n=1 Tax=Glonium stellatum TaxID=574774 RepID=A0A8E2JS00_9PEZI|nr:hypothetical protein AOQ84DRAFT_377815 [Glonium stellatum]
MADPISLTSGVIGVLSLGFRVLDITKQYLGSVQKPKKFTQQSADERFRMHYGGFTTLMVKMLLPDAFRQVQLIEERIFPGGDEVAITFRSSYISDCNMTAVAGAIIAQVAITALSLPFLSETHWAARAFWMASLISGALSVYFACLLQRTVGVLYRAEDIRNWLTRPDEQTLKMLALVDAVKQVDPQEPDPHQQQKDLEPTGLGTPDMTQARQRIPRSASLFSALVMIAPSSMINIALGAFLLGLGIYLGFLWTRHLDTQGGKNDSRDVFIIFIISTVIIIALYATPAAYKGLEISSIENTNRNIVERNKSKSVESNVVGAQSQDILIQTLIDTLHQTTLAQQAAIKANQQLTAEIAKLASEYGSKPATRALVDDEILQQAHESSTPARNAGG